MNINRYNYEEFFMLYVDNELTTAERLEVEDFVDANPDLKEELAMLKQLKLKPDTTIRFEAKELLMKPEQAELINESNYEEFFLLYVDNELDTILRRQVEAFANTNPAFRQELDLLMQTKPEPEHEVVFPDKSLLYRKSEDRKPVVLVWWRVVAVAAMLLLALGIFWLNNRKAANEQEKMAGINTTKEQKSNKTTGASENVADKNHAAQSAEQLQPKNVTEEQQLANTGNKKSAQPGNKEIKTDAPVRDERQYAYEPNTNRQETIEVIDRPVTNADLTNRASNTANTNINTGVETASLNHVAASAQTVAYQPVKDENPGLSDEPDNTVLFANTTVNKKNKLRGFFRKVTRVIEKTANLPAVEEKGILIGNFEIALK